MQIVDFNKKFDAPIAVALGFFDCIHNGHKKLVDGAIDFSRSNGTKSALLTFVNDPNIALGKDKQIFHLTTELKCLKNAD